MADPRGDDEAYLVLEATGQQFAIDGRPVTIGRESVNVVHHQDDPMLSRHHAYVLREARGFFLCDHQSTNGSYLNGQRIHGRVPLRPGDVITCGMTQLRLVTDGDSRPADEGLA